MSDIAVYVIDSSSMVAPAPTNLVDGATVGDALAKANVSSDGCVLRRAGDPVSLGDQVFNGDRITVTRQDLKGANDVIDLITNFTGGNMKAAVADAVKDIEGDTHQAQVEVIKSLAGIAKEHAYSRAARVDSIEKELVKAKEQMNRLNATLLEMFGENENIFPFLAEVGKKDDAYVYCKKLNIGIPENNDPRWKVAE